MTNWRKRFLSLTVVASTFGFGYLGYNYTQNRSFALAEEKREEVVRYVVVMAHGAGVPRPAVQPPPRLQLGPGWTRGERQARRSQGGERESHP